MKVSSSACVVVLALASTFAASPGLAQAPTSVEKPGDGKPTCGLGKAFHAGRRAALCAELKGGLIVCRGEPESRDYLRFRQNKVFWYLTGIESPNASVVIDAKSGKATLFLPPRNTFNESWNGELWDASDEWVKDLTGIDDVRKNTELSHVLEELTAKEKTVWVSMAAHVELAGCLDQAEGYDSHVAKDPFDGRPSREKKFAERLKELYKVDVKDFAPALNELRRVKTPEEIAAMRRAGRAGALAMAEAIRSTKPGIGEWELEGLMSFVQVKEGAAGPAYNAIVGSGRNSLVLHYMDSSRTMQDGETLLIDYAPELDHYTCDITRTWPVNGTFSARQAELYDVVLEAQKAGIAAAKPGATIQQVSKACADVIEAHKLSKLQKHGPCHYIGMEVHDVGGYDKPLVPGVAFTVEPGVYEAETGIGVRIEDVVIVTSDGCEVVSDLVPRERAEIERLIREDGVLDWMAKRGGVLTAEHK